jgi:hypothetical protein
VAIVETEWRVLGVLLLRVGSGYSGSGLLGEVCGTCWVSGSKVVRRGSVWTFHSQCKTAQCVRVCRAARVCACLC